MKHHRCRHARWATLCALLLAVALPASGNEEWETAINKFKAGKYAEAAADFQAVVDQSPNYAGGHHMLGHCFLKMGKTQDAEKEFLKAIEISGDYFESHLGLAKTYDAQKNHAKTVAALRTAEGLATTGEQKFQLYQMRGLAYFNLEKWGEAIEDLGKAKAIKTSPVIVNQLGTAYFKLGHNEKAIPLLREALKATPTNEATTVALAMALIDSGASASSTSQKQAHYNEALSVAEKHQRANPADFDANNLLGRAALGAQDFAKAEQAFTRALEKKPDYCYAMVNLGKVYVAAERWPDAEKILQRAASCAPRMAVIYESLGFVVQKQKRLPEAVAHYEKAHELAPSDSLRASIETCRQNMEIAQHNQAVEQEKAAQDAAALQAQKEYEDALAKQKKWEKEQRKDD